jgi:2-polyprenyl-3-methyl-5-hydroxy-6-metoxy-1,4-benzoquinol methylase
MCLRGVFWRWMAMNRAQVAAIDMSANFATAPRRRCV